MLRRLHVHNHRLCFVPPIVLQSVAQNGTPQQRDAALRTLATDQTFRALRMAQPPRPVQGPARRPRPEAMEVRPRRTIYDAHHTQDLPGEVVRVEGGPPSQDTAVNEAYDGLGLTFEFYRDVYERNSIDDEGLPLDAVVHFGQRYDNAFWDGRQMVFGDGDIFNRFTAALDVIGHELTHGVVEDEAQLVYFYQSGALNESLADVFGSLIKQRARNQTAEQADWLIGSELFAGTNLRGVAIRSMKAPGTAFDDPLLGKDPQPAHMRDYVRTFEDQGGVHINSGIPNHAFYLVASRLGGHAWEKAGRIWYETLRDSRVRPNTGFVRFARRTVANAGELYGTDSPEVRAVTEGWGQVGIDL
ncbi:MAG: M4 family metallopeptidase [Chloroflexota bacterium]|nr:M4 family metallopeptidase [Chloroflexota bacterium]